MFTIVGVLTAAAGAVPVAHLLLPAYNLLLPLSSDLCRCAFQLQLPCRQPPPPKPNPRMSTRVPLEGMVGHCKGNEKSPNWCDENAPDTLAGGQGGIFPFFSFFLV